MTRKSTYFLAILMRLTKTFTGILAMFPELYTVLLSVTHPDICDEYMET